MLFNTHSLKLVHNVDSDAGDDQDASERSQKQSDSGDTS